MAIASLQFAEVTRLEDLAGDFLKTLTDFWIHYEQLRGVGFNVLGARGAKVAAQSVQDHAK